MDTMGKVGRWSFVIGLVIAVLVGLFTEATGVIVSILVILGLIVGFLNVAEKEVHGFLVAAIALLLAGGAGDFMASIPVAGSMLQRILTNFVIFVAPAAIIVAVKELFNITKN